MIVDYYNSTEQNLSKVLDPMYFHSELFRFILETLSVEIIRTYVCEGKFEFGVNRAKFSLNRTKLPLSY